MAKKKLFIPDKLSSEALAVFDSEDIEIDNRPGLPIDEKLAAVADAHAVIIRSATTADAAFLAAASNLEMIVRAGVGVDNVDVDEATRRGIVVQNVPDGNTRSAAEHTIALIMSLSRNVPQAHGSLRDGGWERSKYVGVEILGKTLGVIGLGKIGRYVVEMAKGLGFRIAAFDPFVSPSMAEEIGVDLYRDVGELASQSDFLTVHVPKSPKTLNLINAEVLDKAKPGIRVINCARGGIVDEAALLAAVESGKVAGAALDVFSEEPPTNAALVQHPSIVVTPHLGASTHEAQENVAVSAAQMVVDYFASGKLYSPVNAVVLDPDVREGLEPFGQLARAMGLLQAQLCDSNPERLVIKFYGKSFDEKARSYLVSSVLEGFLRDSSATPVNRVNARAIAQDQGLAIEERSEGNSRYFVDMIKVEVSCDACGRELGGAIRGRRGLRLVSLDAYHFDAVLEGTLLIVANQDRPGMIAELGRVLASHEINISALSLGRDETGGTAISVVSLDADQCPEGAIQDLESTDGILWARSVTV